MERREVLRRRLAGQPPDAIVARILTLEEQLAEAQAFIAESKRQLLGGKAEQLTPEQEAQIKEIFVDLREQRQRSEPLIQEVPTEEQKALVPTAPLHIQLGNRGAIISTGNTINRKREWRAGSLALMAHAGCIVNRPHRHVSSLHRRGRILDPQICSFSVDWQRARL
jgi:hypothetical protein